MTDIVSDDKRNFLKQVALFGTVSSAVGIAMAPSETLAQMLETGVREDSILAKCRKEGVLRVGYAQTGPLVLQGRQDWRAERHLQRCR